MSPDVGHDALYEDMDVLFSQSQAMKVMDISTRA